MHFSFKISSHYHISFKITFHSKFSFKIKTKVQPENLENKLLPRESEFVLCIAPPPFSRDRRIKMKKSFFFIFLFAIKLNNKKQI